MALRGTNQQELTRQLEAQGTEEVRRKLIAGEFGDPGSDEFTLVEIWLDKAMARQASRIAMLAAIMAAIAAIMATIGAIPIIMHILRRLHVLP